MASPSELASGTPPGPAAWDDRRTTASDNQVVESFIHHLDPVQTPVEFVNALVTGLTRLGLRSDDAIFACLNPVLATYLVGRASNAQVEIARIRRDLQQGQFDPNTYLHAVYIWLLQIVVGGSRDATVLSLGRPQAPGEPLDRHVWTTVWGLVAGGLGVSANLSLRGILLAVGRSLASPEDRTAMYAAFRDVLIGVEDGRQALSLGLGLTQVCKFARVLQEGRPLTPAASFSTQPTVLVTSDLGASAAAVDTDVADADVMAATRLDQRARPGRRPPSTPCPRCGGRGHWVRECATDPRDAVGTRDPQLVGSAGRPPPGKVSRDRDGQRAPRGF